MIGSETNRGFVARGLLPVLVLGACAGLGWVVFGQFSSDPTPGNAATTGDAIQLNDLPAQQSFSMPPAEQFSQIVERPLFSPTRQPSAEGPVAVLSTDSDLDVKLVGVIIATEEQIAIVKSAGKAGFVRLGQGDDYKGWTVETIEANRVIFRRGDVEEFVQLTYDEAPKLQRPKRRKRQTGQIRPSNQAPNQNDPESLQQQQTVPVQPQNN